MKKLLIGGAAFTGAVLLAARCASSCRGVDFERLIERMPENAPPKWMFRNITAIRENTELILKLIQEERTAAPASAVLSAG